MYACESGNVALVKFLMNLDSADMDAMAYENTALTLAVTSNAYTGISSILLSAKHPPDVNLQDDEEGKTALFRAVRLNFRDEVKYLLLCDADPRIADFQDRITLMEAGEEEFENDENSEDEEEYQDEDEDEDYEDEDYEYKDVDEPVVALLVRAAPDTVNHRDISGRTVLSHLSGNKRATKNISAFFDVIDDLDLPVDVNSADEDGNTALHYAMLAGCPGTVQLLLSRGAEMQGSGSGETTVLMKPFWDKNTMHDDFGGLVRGYTGGMSSEARDVEIAGCLRMVLSQLTQRLVTLRWIIRKAVRKVVEDEPAAKRRKTE
jgi:ankyrin repeat protein